MLVIYVDWLLVETVNVFCNKYFKKVTHINPPTRTALADYAGVTWFSTLRAMIEVAQVAEGCLPLAVLLSTFRVRTYAALDAVLCTFIIPPFFEH